MAAHLKEAYMPSLEFEEDAKDPLVDLSLNDSTELWLIQWPKNQVRKKWTFLLLGFAFSYLLRFFTHLFSKLDQGKERGQKKKMEAI